MGGKGCTNWRSNWEPLFCLTQSYVEVNGNTWKKRFHLGEVVIFIPVGLLDTTHTSTNAFRFQCEIPVNLKGNLQFNIGFRGETDRE